ncbi:hypothetical protein [Streptococcus ovuberis]|uniref:Uncharacterized protein n=1 Tax=Streptococcus ovuberis TaxID=1936207 RepID=A0A7X6N057_9STRE|nr:hypothetical protein [Streptococcus ovuberis]NKZ20576.1 hypothetical protein [Streptococcus ovuberis]
MELGLADAYEKAGWTDESGTSYARVPLSEEQKKNPLFDYGEEDVDDQLWFSFTTSSGSYEEDVVSIREGILAEVYDLYSLVNSVNRQAYQEDKPIVSLHAGYSYDVDMDLDKIDQHFTHTLTRIHELGTRTSRFDYVFNSSDLDEVLTLLMDLRDEGYFTVEVREAYR